MIPAEKLIDLADTLEGAQAIALNQAHTVGKVLDVLAEVALRAHEPVHSVYEQGRRDGEVELVRRLFELIKTEREKLG
jgi:hypothetical protein